MFDYTRTALDKIKTDFQKITWVSTLVMQIFYIIYLVYALITKAGYLWANIILLALSVGYFAFFLVMKFHELKKGFKKLGKRIYNYSKLVVNTLTLGGTILTLATSEMADIQPLSLVLVTLTIIMWAFQTILHLATPIIESRIEFIKTAFTTDIENYTKPFRATGNFLKKIVGKEVEEEAAPTKTRQLLDKLVEERREEKAQEKLNKKLQKKALKTERKAEKKAAKQEQNSIPTQEEDNE